MRVDLAAGAATAAAAGDRGTTAVATGGGTAEGKTYEHFSHQTLAGMCDNKPWKITYVPGDLDKFAVAPDSPLPEADDDLDAEADAEDQER